jgi:hypothetical protein
LFFEYFLIKSQVHFNQDSESCFAKEDKPSLTRSALLLLF